MCRPGLGFKHRIFSLWVSQTTESSVFFVIVFRSHRDCSTTARMTLPDVQYNMSAIGAPDPKPWQGQLLVHDSMALNLSNQYLINTLVPWPCRYYKKWTSKRSHHIASNRGTDSYTYNLRQARKILKIAGVVVVQLSTAGKLVSG